MLADCKASIRPLNAMLFDVNLPGMLAVTLIGFSGIESLFSFEFEQLISDTTLPISMLFTIHLFLIMTMLFCIFLIMVA